MVGYGLDFRERYRNLRDIGTLAPHVYGGDEKFHRVPGETGAPRLEFRAGSGSFTGYPVKLRGGVR